MKPGASSFPPRSSGVGHTLECVGAPPEAASSPEQVPIPVEVSAYRPSLSSVLTTTSDTDNVDAQRLDRIDREELVSDIMRLRFLSMIGAIGWASFFIQDWMVVRYSHQGSLSHFVTVRAIGMAYIILVVIRLRMKKPITRRLLNALDIGTFGFTNLCIALLSLGYGGIASRYAQGVIITLVSRTTVLAAPWRRGLILLGTPILFFPLTLLVCAAFDAGLRAQFSDPKSLSVFIQNLYVHALSLGICVWGGHGNWTMRRQLFESRSIGKYALKRRIGRGGMGEVWLAYHSGLQRDVALKILRQDPDSDPIAVRRFEQEVAAMTQLTHPNTVRIFDHGVTEDGIWYYAMELLEGVNLREFVEQSGPLQQPRALRIAHRISRALAEAHQRGIVHRDVKPENIFITRAGNEPDFVKVLDFGIAKVRGSQVNDGLTRAGAIFGTPAYMSPEAARGAEAGTASDVYGVGALLFFMLTGRPPFTGRSATEILLAQVQSPIPLLTDVLGTTVRSDVEMLVQKCLAKSPADRFVDATELSTALSELRAR
jgi:eukaryotic-like serine/threonine-protein kinase